MPKDTHTIHLDLFGLDDASFKTTCCTNSS